MTSLLASIGEATLGPVWLPILAWTVMSGLVVLVLRRRRSIHPLLRFRLLQALLFGLPAVLLLASLTPIGRIPGGVMEPAVPAAQVVPGSPATMATDLALVDGRDPFVPAQGASAVGEVGEVARPARNPPRSTWSRASPRCSACSSRPGTSAPS